MAVDFIDDQLLLLIQEEDGGKRRQFVQVNLSAKEQRTTLFTARGTKGFDSRLHLIRKGSKNYLWYESFNHPFQKKKRVDIQAFDSDFQALWHDSLLVDHKDRLAKIHRFKVNRKGDYELILRKYFINTMKVRYGKPNSEIWYFRYTENGLEEHILLDKSKFYTGLMIKQLNEGWQISGLYSKKFKNRDGLFHLTFENGVSELHHLQPLSSKIGRKMHPLNLRNKIHDLVLDHRIDSDSFVYWVAEEFSYRLKGTQTNPAYELRYGSILILKTDRANELVDWKVVGKKQIVSSRMKHFASYQLGIDSNQMRIYMNPSQRIILKRKSFDVLGAKDLPGFYVLEENLESAAIELEERYYPVDIKRLPLLGSISKKEGKMFMILVAKNGKYYLPVYAQIN
jgi:hypothetical protein